MSVGALLTTQEREKKRKKIGEKRPGHHDNKRLQQGATPLARSCPLTIDIPSLRCVDTGNGPVQPVAHCATT